MSKAVHPCIPPDLDSAAVSAIVHLRYNAAQWRTPRSRTTVKLFCSGTPLFLSSKERVAGAAVPALSIDRQAAVPPNTCSAAAAAVAAARRIRSRQ